MEKILEEEIKNNFVTLINFRGYRGNFGGPQMSSYYDCYGKNNLNYDWIAFFDADEYLELIPNNLTIQDFLNNSRYNNCESIKINWRVFSDNNFLYYEDKPLNERFVEKINESHWINTVVKPIIRGNLSNYNSKKSFYPHNIFNNTKSCNSNGEINQEIRLNPVYKYAVLNHYYTKSIQEYCTKIKRGRAFLNDSTLDEPKKFYFDFFFLFNKKTKEKINFFNNAFNTSFK